MTKKHVVVAMSGGVDSSVAAALLLEQGYEVEGVTMRLWHDPFANIQDTDAGDAAKVCSLLGIRHQVVAYQELFRNTVVDYFLWEYAAGRTPNPCVYCNKKIKFGALYDMAMHLGADYLATGHYARIAQEADGVLHIRRAAYLDKDQSYVLYHLNQEHLRHVLFPLGEYNKQQIRCLAEAKGLPVFSKKDSQDICFIPDNDHHRFLCTYGKIKDSPGAFVLTDGRIVGRHRGLSHYTVGQRKGMGIAAAEPLYVLALDVHRNEVIVGGAEEAWCVGLTAKKIELSDGSILNKSFKAQVKIRYNAKLAEAEIVPGAHEDEAKVLFDTPLRGIAPGQTVVFYQGDTCIGGGMIDAGIKQK